MDYFLFRAVNGLSGSSFDGLMKLLTNDLPVVLAVLVAFLFLVPRRARHLESRYGAVLATVAATVTQLVNQPISHIVDRMRPYLAHPGHAHLLISRSHDPSFPSDHATAAFALAMGVWLYNRTFGSVLLVLGAILAFSRVYTGTHYPGDVVGGALIGMAVALLLHVQPARSQLEKLTRWCSAVWEWVSISAPRLAVEGLYRHRHDGGGSR